jgi:hypothetical protein
MGSRNKETLFTNKRISNSEKTLLVSCQLNFEGVYKVGSWQKAVGKGTKNITMIANCILLFANLKFAT